MANKKKIFDITPPSPGAKKPVKPVVPVKPPSPVKPPTSAKPPVKPPAPKFSPKKSLKPLIEKMQRVVPPPAQPPRPFKVNKPILIASVLLIVLIIAVLFIESKAVIEVRPVKNSMELSVQFSGTSQTMEKDYFSSQEFNTTGRAVREDKAQGVIRVYNNYDLDQILVANTRFWCFVGEELREFKTKERVVIPAGQQLDVEVIASAAGPEYNIEPCTFSVPGLKGSARYTAVYGESLSSMTGGKKVEVTQVAQADLDNAEVILKERALKECQENLLASLSDQEYIVIEEVIEAQVTELIPLTEVGQVVDNFVFQVRAACQVLVVRSADLQNFARDYALSQVPEDQVLVEGSLGVSYLPEEADFGDNEIVLDVEINAETYQAINENYLKERVKELRPDEIRTALRNLAEIDQVQARLSPFWATTAPADPARIEIKVIVD